MGPRLISRGNQSARGRRRLGLMASMGPRLISRGNAGERLPFGNRADMLQWGRD